MILDDMTDKHIRSMKKSFQKIWLWFIMTTNVYSELYLVKIVIDIHMKGVAKLCSTQI